MKESEAIKELLDALQAALAGWDDDVYLRTDTFGKENEIVPPELEAETSRLEEIYDNCCDVLVKYRPIVTKLLND